MTVLQIESSQLSAPGLQQAHEIIDLQWCLIFQVKNQMVMQSADTSVIR